MGVRKREMHVDNIFSVNGMDVARVTPEGELDFLPFAGQLTGPSALCLADWIRSKFGGEAPVPPHPSNG